MSTERPRPTPQDAAAGPDPATTTTHVARVHAGVERVFWAFVNLDLVKPREHNLLAVPIAETVVEPRVGGAITDRGVDGSICHWGTVERFEPPHRFAFRWHIGPTWRLEDDPARSSLVDVRFDADADAGGTTVTLVHSELDRHGPGWEGLRDGLAGPGGWPLYLDRVPAALPPVPEDRR